jgi:bifunctional non-homologous end joining protein LigD
MRDGVNHLIPLLTKAMDTGASAGAEPGRKERSNSGYPKALNALMVKYPAVQLATLVDEPPEGDGWFHEIKFDGYRLLGFLAGGEVCLRTRSGLDWTLKFPSLVAAIKRLKVRDGVLDMEAVILDGNGKSSFQALQAALGDGGKRERIVAYAFDLLHLDGKDLIGLALRERKQRLENLLRKSQSGSALQFSEHVIGNGHEMLSRSCRLGLEGIVSKLADAPYRAGRSKNWLKSKCAQRQEFIIIGYSDARSGGRALGALYLGYYQDDQIRYAGKVGTGFTMTSARDLTDRVAPLVVEKPVLARMAMSGIPTGEWKSIHWVKPQLLCEVAFTEWTVDGLIRHPSFQGLRED